MVEQYGEQDVDKAISVLGTDDFPQVNAFLEALISSEGDSQGDPRGPGVPNDVCSTAIPLTLGTSVTGNNSTATDDTQVSCGTTSVNQGMWYTFVGNGNNYTITTCLPGTDFDTKFQVWCNCPATQCVAGNDDAAAPFDAACETAAEPLINRKSRLVLCTVPGQIYYLSVGGFGTQLGNFELLVTDSGTPCCALPCVASVPSNDNCATALDLSALLPYSNDCIDTRAATASPFVAPIVGCNSTTATETKRDVWYKYTATADCLLSIQANPATFDGVYIIWSGVDCSSLTQLQCDDDPEPYSIQINATAGTTYWLQFGSFGTSAAVAGGRLTLNVTCSETGGCCRFDGTCENDVPPGDCLEANGDVFSGAVDCVPETCGGSCCWFSAENGEQCDDTNELSCINDFGGIFTAGTACGSPEACPTAKCCYDNEGTPACGDFTEDHCADIFGEFTPDEVCVVGSCLPPANDTCETATAVACGDVVNGTNIDATDDYTFDDVTGCSGFDSAGPDVVYSFSFPIDREVTITMDPVAFDLGLYVVTDCANENVTCVAGDDSGGSGSLEEVTFTAIGGTTYFIIVDTFANSGEPGDDFVLTVACGFPECASCPADLTGDGRLDGRDIQPFTDCAVGAAGGIPGPDCGCADMDADQDVDQDDVAAFAAALVDFENKTCSETGRCCIDNGAVCQDDTTVEECDGAGGTHTPGETCATECPSIPDVCEDAILVAVPSNTIGDNLSSTDDLDPAPCGLFTASNQAVWYSFIGTGNTITVSTCNPGTNFDTMIEVFCGPSCVELLCVAGNDDATPNDPACHIPPGTINRRSRLSFCSASGQLYYVRVGGFSTTTGTFELSLADGAPCGDPPSCVPATGACCDAGDACTVQTEGACEASGGIYLGDDSGCDPNPCAAANPPAETCAAATVIESVPFSFTFDNNTALADPPSAGSCNVGGATVVQNAVWYQFTPDEDCVLAAEVDNGGPFYDIVAAVYSGPNCNTLVQEACGDAEPILMLFPATAGTTYWIQIGDWGTGEGGGITNFSLDCTPATPSACCNLNGFCEDVPEAFCNGVFTSGQLCADVACDSCVTCTDSELEGNCGILTDNFNGGCNSTPNIFTPLTCGQTVCGTGWGDDAVGRDTDWYQITVAGASQIDWAVTGDFDVQLFIFDSAGGCPPAVALDDDVGAPCTPVTSTAIVSAGTYWLFVGDADFGGNTCALGPWTYTATVTCTPVDGSGACCTAGDCTTATDEDACETGGGTFQGLGTLCGEIVCPPPAPANDSCAGAVDITANINGAQLNGDNTSAGPATGPDSELPAGSPSCQWQAVPGNTNHTVWYSFVAPANGSITVGTCNSPPNPTSAPGIFKDSIIALYSGNCGALTQVACSEDVTGCGADGFFSRITMTTLTPGQTYRLLVANPGGWTGSIPGPFVVDVTSP
ncbi:MAG TPA: PPC domain-containing protein [Phycisphaerae bacterium]|nr:PPC domain-containing protein [Phycisphaerae bacterium]